MPSLRVFSLTKRDITIAAKSFRWGRQLPKWSVVVEGRELPARPLVLDAAGVPPNDPTNSHQAVAILQERGFEIRYNGKTIRQEEEKANEALKIDDLISKLRGSCKVGNSLTEAREREHRDDTY
jgi:hypothetical protein